jgi:DNA-directed RNA polymerase sigma subunit (sigma70/sigma32)
LVQTASLIGLMVAAQNYEAASSASFVTFASRSIDWTISLIVRCDMGNKSRRNKPRRRQNFEPSAYRSSGEMPDAFWDEQNSEAVVVESKTPEALAEAVERARAARRILDELGTHVLPRDIAIFRRHLDGEPFAVIARSHGVSRQRVEQICRKLYSRARLQFLNRVA